MPVKCAYCGRSFDIIAKPHIKIPVKQSYGFIFLCRIKCALDFLKGADEYSKKIVIKQLKDVFHYEVKK